MRTALALAMVLALPRAFAAQATDAPTVPSAGDAGLAYIDTSFENASPVWYETLADGTTLVHLLYDHERSSPNRAAGHIHFRIEARRGARITVELTNLDNVWNGVPGSVAGELKAVVVSENGGDWRPVATEALPGDRVRLSLVMPGSSLYVARVEPYRVSDLDRLLASVRRSPLVEITPIGRTVQGRELEIVRIGNPAVPYRVFVRARAHPWEAGGSWVVEGLVRRLLEGDAEAARFRQRYCVYVLPMANKDGVARGMTRFNVRGKDLNRDWDRPADPDLAPENAALERWLDGMIAAGRRPHLALEMHNDGGGNLHLSRPARPEQERHLARMAVLERLLRRHTWFTEGSLPPPSRSSGTLGDGWLERYDVDAVVHELDCNWIAGLHDYPSARHWRAYGASLARVFDEYFGAVTP
jgi:Zinc carboxypeptidase